MKHVYLASFCVVGFQPTLFESVFFGIPEISDEHKNLVIQLESPILTNEDLLQILEYGKKTLAKRTKFKNMEPGHEHQIELRTLSYLSQHHV